MKTTIIIGSLLLISTLSFCKSKTDSITALLEMNVSYGDKSEMFSDLVMALYEENPTEAIKVAIDKLNFSKNHGDEKEVAIAYELIAYGYQKNKNYELSLEHYLHAVNSYSSTGDTLGLINSYLNIGYLFNCIKAPEKAFDYLEKVKFFLKFKPNKEALTNYHINMARSYRQQFDHENEIYHLSRCDKESNAYYTNLGTAYWKLRNFKAARTFYQKAYEQGKETNDSLLISKALNNLGINEYSLGNYEKAILHHTEALRYRKQDGKANLELANCMISLNDTRLAEIYLEKAYKGYDNLEELIEVAERLADSLNAHYEFAGAAFHLLHAGRLKDSLQSTMWKDMERSYRSKFKMEQVETHFSHSENLKLYEEKIKLKEENFTLKMIFAITALAIIGAILGFYILKSYRVKSVLEKMESDQRLFF